MSLFKYLHFDRIDILRGLSIRFSSPAVLNDPFELKPHLAKLSSPEYLEAAITRLLPGIAHEEFERLPSEVQSQVSVDVLHDMFLSRLPQAKLDIQAMTQTFMPMLQQVIARKFDELIGILCLSESPDNLLMWAHYADSHRGFVIEFDERAPFFNRRVNDEDELRHLRRVAYSPTRPSLTLSDLNDFSPFMIKGTDWEYEAEWRMILPLDEASKVIGEGTQAVHLFEFPAKAIRAVILGCRMASDKKEEVRQILSSFPHFNHVRCMEAEIDDEHYQVRVPLQTANPAVQGAL